MNSGVKKRTAFLVALVMIGSLVVAPASADGSATGKTPITITVEDEVRKYRQENPAAWSYRITEGTLVGDDSIEDLVNGSPVCAADRNSKVGEYPITLTKKEGAGNYDVTIENGTLTIEPAMVTSFSPDEPLAHYITIYANDPFNISAEGLKSLVAARAGTYTACYDGGTVELKPIWSADADGEPYDFNPKGKTENIWYPYSAVLSTARDSDAKNFKLDVESPQAYVRVIPVSATQTLTPNAATVTASAVEALTNEDDVKAALNLPKTASVTYTPNDAPNQYSGETGGKYAITGWKMDDGQKFTLEALRSIAASVTDGQEAEVTLTPVYAAAGDKAIPEWATLEEAPKFTLLVTEKTPVAAAVQAPDSITYGEALGDPVMKPKINSGIGAVTYRYVGVDGTRYDSTDKPTAAGSYRVVAVLTGASHSGRWTSETFVIRPKAVTVAGINGTSKVYDGDANANAALDTSRAVINGMVKGDDLHASASGYFVNKNAGASRTVVIINIALTGESVGNYTLSASGNQTRTTANITPKPLEIDDSGITVSKEYDGTKAAGTLEGRLKLKGVINDEVKLVTSRVKVSPYANSNPGANKTVILSGLELSGSGVYNYTLADSYAFTEAEITAKPRPMLNTDFTAALPNATYDGRPHAAAVSAKDGVTGLGAATVTYAKRRADGAYDAPAAEEPVEAGAYKVFVSFEEGADFAAIKGRNAIEAGTLTIKKASAAAAAVITVPVTAAERKIQLSALDLPADMARGLKIKEAPSVGGDDGDVLKKVTGGVGKTSFTLKTKTVKGSDKTQDFNLVLGSDNYVKLTVTVTVIAAGADIEITPPAVTVKKEVSEYGTSPEDIISLEGGSATLNGTRVPGAFTLPDRPYDAGRYTDIEVLFHSFDGNYQNVSVKVHAVFTIKKAVVTSVSPDESLTHYITIYANDPFNISAGELKNLVAARAGTYTGCYSGGTVELKASWSAVSTAKPYHFNPKGKAENVWYPYVAALTTAEDSDAKNFKLDIDSPQAYVRVIPVSAAQTLTPNAATVTAAAVKGLTNENMKAALGLPETVDVTYRPIEELPSSEFEETFGECAITGWRMNGKPLTLKALQAKAAGASRKDVEITLTPVYANDAVSAWATLTSVPTFKLTITAKPR